MSTRSPFILFQFIKLFQIPVIRSSREYIRTFWTLKFFHWLWEPIFSCEYDRVKNYNLVN